MQEEIKYYYQNGNNLIVLKEPLSVLPKDYIEITEEEFERKQEELRILISTPISKLETVGRIYRLKMLLSSSDYKQHKWLDGELTDEEYAPIKAQRHAWRVEINQLEEEIENAQ